MSLHNKNDQNFERKPRLARKIIEAKELENTHLKNQNVELYLHLKSSFEEDMGKESAVFTKPAKAYFPGEELSFD